MGAILEDHNRLPRRAIRDAEGVEIRTEGDSFFAAFPTALAAVGAAAAAQRALAAHRWPPEAPVRVRMGMHTGEETVGGDSYSVWTSTEPPGSRPPDTEARC